MKDEKNAILVLWESFRMHEDGYQAMENTISPQVSVVLSSIFCVPFSNVNIVSSYRTYRCTFFNDSLASHILRKLALMDVHSALSNSSLHTDLFRRQEFTISR